MKKLIVLLAVMMVLPAIPAVAGQKITMSPRSFGAHTYASWKGMEGEADSSGSAKEAFYMQKMTATAESAAAIADFRGVRGLPTSDIWPLAFDVRIDGHCGAGAPRFVLVTDEAPGGQFYLYGCQAMTPSAAQEPLMWVRRSTVGPPPGGNVLALAIVFDEGNDQGPGYTYLDNIQVGQHIWTSAADNGNN